MKTVMKKMFSLLLVAVLLVGAMPFQAFADGTAIVEVIVNNAGTGVTAAIDAGPQSANAIKAVVNYTADGIVTDFCVTDSNGGNMVVFDETIDEPVDKAIDEAGDKAVEKNVDAAVKKNVKYKGK